MRLRVDIRELVEFYDENSAARPHANAIKTLAGEELGLALLDEYLSRSGSDVKILDVPCTTGSTKGARLDAWLRVEQGSEKVDYQVEVKTWSFHSLGGRRLPWVCSAEELTVFKRQTWSDYWTGNDFREPELNKVLTAMKPPPGAANRIEPLACLWVALHPDGGGAAFFRVPVTGYSFTHVSIFSMSAFLRGLGQKTIALRLPLAAERLRCIGRIFSFLDDSAGGSDEAGERR